MLKPLVAITVFLQFFLSTELHQLFKIPIFIAHFMEHREENKRISFGEFFSIHYLQGNIKDADYDRDMQLPFKTHDCTSFHVVSISFNMQPVSVPVAAENIITDYPPMRNHSLLPSHVTDIWEPPRSFA